MDFCSVKMSVLLCLILIQICSSQLYPEDATLRSLSKEKHKRICNLDILYQTVEDQPAAMNFYAYSPAKSATDCAKQCYERMNFCFSARFDLNKEERIGRCSFSYYRQLNCEVTNTTEFGGLLQKHEVLLCIRCGIAPPPQVDLNRLPGDIKPTEFFEQKDHHNVTVNKTTVDIPIPRAETTSLPPAVDITKNQTAGGLLTSSEGMPTTSTPTTKISVISTVATSDTSVLSVTNSTILVGNSSGVTTSRNATETATVSQTQSEILSTANAIPTPATDIAAVTTESSAKESAKSDLLESNATTVQLNSTAVVKDHQTVTVVNCTGSLACGLNHTNATQTHSNSSDLDLALHSNLGKLSHGVMENLINYIATLNATQNSSESKNNSLISEIHNNTTENLGTTASSVIITTGGTVEVASITTPTAVSSVIGSTESATTVATTAAGASGWYQLPECTGNFTYEVKKKATDRELKWYYKVKTNTIHDCASHCFRLPFCVSAAYEDHTCYFSYERHDCKSFKTEKFDETLDMPATIFCLQCL